MHSGEEVNTFLDVFLDTFLDVFLVCFKRMLFPIVDVVNKCTIIIVDKIY